MSISRKTWNSLPLTMREKKSIRSRAPQASSPKVRRVMQHNTGNETIPEKLLRSAIHKTGLRFRKDLRPEPTLKITADIVFPRQKVCVFVDGCYWHGCPVHFNLPKTNSEWWMEKITDNRNRDARQNSLLTELGWKVIRYWEHDVVVDNLPRLCEEIKCAVKHG